MTARKAEARHDLQRLSLAGDWKFHRVGSRASHPARVPGSVHADLLALGEIEDPFFRDNEKDLQWIGEADWCYWRVFRVSASLLKSKRVLLRCHGLDTLATIRLNGQRVGRADNMHRVWEFDVTRKLKAGPNRIEITFASAAAAVRKLQKAERLPGWFQMQCLEGASWLRKEACNFGWDWGPGLVTCGIWREIELVAFDTARLVDMHVHQHHSGNREVELEVHLRVEYAAARRPPLQAVVTLLLRGQSVASQRRPISAGRSRVSLPIDRAELWWPNGMGEQPLYTLCVEIRDAADRRIDAQSRRIGLRTLELVREADEWG